jgi:predicted signal transduction protein with EAL and GGDEF domain
MYSAKAAGKGTYRLFSTAMQARAIGRMQLESDLAQALD